MWTCGRSRWQLGMVLASHARTFGAQNSQRFWRIAELINPAMDGNNIIISEEIHRVYWIQIMLMSVLSLQVLSRCVYTSKFYPLSIVQFHEKGCMDCAHPGNKVSLKTSLTQYFSIHSVKFSILLRKYISCCTECRWCPGQISLTRTVVPIPSVVLVLVTNGMN